MSNAVSRRTLLGALMGAPAMAMGMSACDSASASPAKLRLGYFANVTHAPALVGTGLGIFAKHLGSTQVETQVFTAGPQAVQAMLAGALDIAYLGPSPAVVAWTRTKGEGVRLISGAAGGGAGLVVRNTITSLDGLRGKTVATPQLGGTQDVALKVLLAQHGIRVGAGRDEVEVVWMANSQTFDQFRQGRLDAAYLPEPWVSRLVVEAGARQLVDEADLWPHGQFATTSVLASQAYLRRYPTQTAAFLAGHIESVGWLNNPKNDRLSVVNTQVKKLTGKSLRSATLQRAMQALTFTANPYASTLAQVARHTYDVGAIDERPNLAGLVDLRSVNAELERRGLARVSAAGLGQQ